MQKWGLTVYEIWAALFTILVEFSEHYINQTILNISKEVNLKWILKLETQK